MVTTFSELLARWTAAELASDLGVGYPTAQSMKRRNVVGMRHWPRLIEAASRKGLRLDEATLLRLWHARRAVERAA